MKAEPFAIGTIVAVWLLMLISGAQLVFFHCPRCNEYFLMKGIVFRLFAAKCANCGLQKWAASDGGSHRDAQLQRAEPGTEATLR